MWQWEWMIPVDGRPDAHDSGFWNRPIELHGPRPAKSLILGTVVRRDELAQKLPPGRDR
jgi:hypothetical protein